MSHCEYIFGRERKKNFLQLHMMLNQQHTIFLGIVEQLINVSHSFDYDKFSCTLQIPESKEKLKRKTQQGGAEIILFNSILHLFKLSNFSLPIIFRCSNIQYSVSLSCILSLSAITSILQPRTHASCYIWNRCIYGFSGLTLKRERKNCTGSVIALQFFIQQNNAIVQWLSSFN